MYTLSQCFFLKVNLVVATDGVLNHVNRYILNVTFWETEVLEVFSDNELPKPAIHANSRIEKIGLKLIFCRPGSIIWC